MGWSDPSSCRHAELVRDPGDSNAYQCPTCGTVDSPRGWAQSRRLDPLPALSHLTPGAALPGGCPDCGRLLVESDVGRGPTLSVCMYCGFEQEASGGE